ncbi:MFS transporter [Halalkalicoccus tibetensis]
MAVSRPRVVGPVTVGHGINEFFAIVIPPIIPLLVSDLGITYGQAGFLLTIFFIMYSIFQLPAGILADRIGKIRLMIVGLVGMSGAIFFASVADRYGMLLVAQTLAGIGGSTFHPTGMLIISDVETHETEGKAMGVFGFGGALGTMSSPLVVGGLAAIAGWRIALLGAALLGITVTAVSILFLIAATSDGEGTLRADGGRSIRVRDLFRPRRRSIDIPITREIVLLFLITLVLFLQHRAIQTFTTSYIAAETGASTLVGNLAFFTLLVGGSFASLWAGDLADRFDWELLGAGTAVTTAIFVSATLLVTRVLGGIRFEVLIAILALWFAIIGVMMYVSYPVKNALVSEQANTASSGTSSASSRRRPWRVVRVVQLSSARSRRNGASWPRFRRSPL